MTEYISKINVNNINYEIKDKNKSEIYYGANEPEENSQNVNDYWYEIIAPVSVSIVTPPNKTEYQDGETLTMEGLKISVTDSSGFTEILSYNDNRLTYNPSEGTEITTDLTSVKIDIEDAPAAVYATQEITVEPSFEGLTFTAEEANSTITLGKTGSPSWNGYYSTDGNTWIDYVPGTTGAITLANVGDKIYFKGTYTAATTSSNCLQYSMTGKIAASGNIMSLCSGDDYRDIITIPYAYMFCGLFYNCTSLTTPPELPATTLTECCYQNMFYYCTSLITMPKLSATSLAECCYSWMFSGCESLTSISTLPAIAIAQDAYELMFYNCTSIKLSTTKDSNYTQEYRIPTSGTGVIEGDALGRMFTNTGGTFTGKPSINTTYYLHKDCSII